MQTKLPLLGQITNFLCSMLFMKLLFTFIGFTILTFLNKGKLSFLLFGWFYFMYILKTSFLHFTFYILFLIIVIVVQMVQNQDYFEMGGRWWLPSRGSCTGCSVWRWNSLIPTIFFFIYKTRTKTLLEGASITWTNKQKVRSVTWIA